MGSYQKRRYCPRTEGHGSTARSALSHSTDGLNGTATRSLSMYNEPYGFATSLVSSIPRQAARTACFRIHRRNTSRNIITNVVRTGQNQSGLSYVEITSFSIWFGFIDVPKRSHPSALPKHLQHKWSLWNPTMQVCIAATVASNP